MECILLRFPTNVIGFSFEELWIENARISNLNDADRGSDCEGDGPAKLNIEMKSDWQLICFTFVMKSPGSVLCFSLSTSQKNKSVVIQ